ncbi:hypothetical protein MMC07_008028 [Pseudocyphellaria aurata]|nr:hypothetical protein [Pseudocyphellaria aurata]
MCGIYFSCTRQKGTHHLDNSLHFLKRRGPDSFKCVHTAVNGKTSDTTCNNGLCVFYLTFVATVLSLRGDCIIEQPLEDEQSGSILCWNGEAWKINGAPIYGNDAVAVLDLLVKAISARSDSSNKEISPSEEASRAASDLISTISGPYAFVFYDSQHERIFYGRDALGRRSLLQKIDGSGNLMLSSVFDFSEAGDWSEVEPGFIYSFEFASKSVSHQTSFKVSGARKTNKNTLNDHNRCPANINLPKKMHFSKSPFPELNKDITSTSQHMPGIDSMIVNELTQKLRYSLSLRVQNIPSPPSTATVVPRVAILFSGGLDCTLLARLMHDLLPQEQDIDLLNVAFENPRAIRAARSFSPQSTYSITSAYSICPDRATGISSHAELLRVCPGRMWRFVSIDVPYSETLAHRPDVVKLMLPHNTEMDLSIACALYFAARGSGTVHDNTTGDLIPYTTRARVLVSGLGADELFAGYTRHAFAFDRKGYQGLVDEIELDFKRLGKRNLGRDDRVISNWGREVRYPYLDEELVTWALKLPVWGKCGFRKQHPSEDEDVNRESLDLDPAKRTLRLLAWNLGMRGVAMERKRAIQFGARTAKMENGKSKGTQELS